MSQEINCHPPCMSIMTFLFSWWCLSISSILYNLRSFTICRLQDRKHKVLVTIIIWGWISLISTTTYNLQSGIFVFIVFYFCRLFGSFSRVSPDTFTSGVICCPFVAYLSMLSNAILHHAINVGQSDFAGNSCSCWKCTYFLSQVTFWGDPSEISWRYFSFEKIPG